MSLTTNVKTISIIVPLLISCIGVGYALDKRYVTDTEAASSLVSFNAKMEQDISKIRMQILELKQSGVIAEYYKHRQLLRAFPDDAELLMELDEIRERKKLVNQEISELFREK